MRTYSPHKGLPPSEEAGKKGTALKNTSPPRTLQYACVCGPVAVLGGSQFYPPIQETPPLDLTVGLSRVPGGSSGGGRFFLFLCEHRIGTGPPRAKTEVIHVDLGYWAVSGQVMRLSLANGSKGRQARSGPTLQLFKRAPYLITASIHDEYSICRSVRPVCTSCYLTMICVVIFIDPEYLSKILVQLRSLRVKSLPKPET